MQTEDCNVSVNKAISFDAGTMQLLIVLMVSVVLLGCGVSWVRVSGLQSNLGMNHVNTCLYSVSCTELIVEMRIVMSFIT